jgi:hypothetical protein
MSVLLLAVDALAAQSVIMSTDGACDECLEVTDIVVLGAVTDSVSIRGLPVVEWVADHWVVAGPMTDYTTLLLYSESGDLVSSVGRAGDGPGEVRMISSLGPARGDSVVVGELLGRLHLFSIPGGGARTLPPTEVGSALLQLESGPLISAGPVPSRRSVGYPLRRLDPVNGTVERLKLEQPPTLRPDHRAGASRMIARASDSTFWASRPDAYVLSERSLDGTVVRRLERSADWFPERNRDPDYEDGAVPTLVDLTADERGVWVLVWTADAGWEEPEDGSRAITPGRLRAKWDTRLELIDPIQGSVISSRTFDEAYLGLTEGAFLYSVRDTPAGLRETVLTRISLKR